jgi:uncharacterized protein (TIGR03437 family)
MTKNTPRTVTAVLTGMVSVVGLFAQPTIIAVVNGASFQMPSIATCSPSSPSGVCDVVPSIQPGLASNTWVSIFGTNLALSTRTWTNSDFVGGTLPTSLDGVSVMMTADPCYSSTGTCPGSPAYVEYISPNQINVLTPNVSDWAYPIAVGNLVRIIVTTAQGTSNWFSAQILPAAPAFFTVGGNYVAARHADGTLVGKSNMLPGVFSLPAKPGEIIALYGTGFGPTNPMLPIANLVTTPAPLAACETSWPYPAVVMIGTPLSSATWAATQYAGLVESGLYQINVTIPKLLDGDMPIGSALCGPFADFNETPSFYQTQAGLLITIQN